jgi:flagella basal body P-ring formation protein FlgA
MLGFLLAVIAPMACHAVNSDFIHGQDLVKAVPGFAALPADARISASPLAGQQRVFRVAELKKIAQTYRIAAEPGSDVCFAWETAVSDQKDIEAAMRKSLTGREARIEIVESSSLAVPKGDMVFPLSGLTLSATQATTLWRGYVQYGETRRFPIWARVKVTVKETHLIAVKDLNPGETLEANLFKTETYEGPLLRDEFVADPKQAEGMRLKVAVRAGSALMPRMLDAPLDIAKGELVNAIVENGAARLEVQAEAQENGRTGQVITVKNTRSGRTFHARVAGKGTVLVVPGGQYGLALETKKS